MTQVQPLHSTASQPPPRDGCFDLRRQTEVLRTGAQYLEHGHAARTLIKAPMLRIVLVTLRRGRKLAAHVMAEPVSIQVLDGRVRVAVDKRPVDLEPGRLMSIQRGVPHDVEALTSAAILLTLPWEPD